MVLLAVTTMANETPDRKKSAFFQRKWLAQVIKCSAAELPQFNCVTPIFVAMSFDDFPPCQRLLLRDI